MASKQGGERRPVSTRRWECNPNHILCESGDHLLAYYESGYRRSSQGLSGHDWLQCRNCNPPCYFLAVCSTKPSPIVYCFAISRETYMEWESQNDTPPTDELLYHIRDPDGKSFNPYWRPASTRRQA